jgi:hypothetical protein
MLTPLDIVKVGDAVVSLAHVFESVVHTRCALGLRA